MRSIALSILIFTLFPSVKAQSDYDAVDAKDLYILKTDSVFDCKLKISKYNLRGVKQAEQIFGSNYTLLNYYSELFDENFTQMTYSDGLKLTFSDDHKHLFTFSIDSDRYTMVLANGKQIRIGMKGDELSTIYPKSYSKRAKKTYSGTWNGKTSLTVYFSFMTDNKITYADEWITFIMSDMDGILEHFFSYVPG